MNIEIIKDQRIITVSCNAQLRRYEILISAHGFVAVDMANGVAGEAETEFLAIQKSLSNQGIQ